MLEFNLNQGIDNVKDLNGTLATLLTDTQKVASIGTNWKNIKNTKKQAFIELYNKDDEYIGRVFLSANIGAQLRAKEIQRADLLHYPLVQRTRPETGESYYLITDEQTEIDKVSVSDAKKPKKTKVPTWEELMASLAE